MRAPLLLPTFALVLAPAALAARPVHHAAPEHRPAAHAAPGPKSIGTFEDWQAATHEEGGQTACYAFVRASASSPRLPGRGDVVLTVTERPGTGRDAVAISAGYNFPPNAAVTLSVDATRLDFYTDGKRSAFARDGHAAVVAFDKGARAVAKSSGPRGVEVSDTFSLRGFSGAYAAITKACPVKS